jgi:hypothetical protein
MPRTLGTIEGNCEPAASGCEKRTSIVAEQGTSLAPGAGRIAVTCNGGAGGGDGDPASAFEVPWIPLLQDATTTPAATAPITTKSNTTTRGRTTSHRRILPAISLT